MRLQPESVIRSIPGLLRCCSEEDDFHSCYPGCPELPNFGGHQPSELVQFHSFLQIYYMVSKKIHPAVT